MKNALMARQANDWFAAPAVEFKNEKDRLVVRMSIPGMEKEGLSVIVDEGLLTLRGEKKEHVEKRERDCFWSEHFEGSFMRAIELPVSVSPDRAKASYRDGILEVTLPKGTSVAGEEVSVHIQ